MAPIIEVSDGDLKAYNQLGLKYKMRPDLESKPSNSDLSGFVRLPSGIHVAKQRTHLGKNWFDSHKALQSEGLNMPTIPEFVEFLQYLKASGNAEYQSIYNDITEVRSPWRAEWLDADFKKGKKDLYIHYNHVLDSKGELSFRNSEPLVVNTLVKDRTPGISLDDFLNSNHTSQGLPTENVAKGDLYYWYPRSDNNSVARFGASDGRAYLSCSLSPSDRDSSLGVRAVKKA
ncbi:MAG: hypothetical protein AABW51_04590 [Nanoarchaeota archaeon]